MRRVAQRGLAVAGAEPVAAAATVAGVALVALAAAAARAPSALWLAAGYGLAAGALTLLLRRSEQPLLRTLAASAGLTCTVTLAVAYVLSAGLALLPSAALWLLALRGAPWESEQASLVLGAGLLGGLVAGVLVVALLPGVRM